ncbi:hypothetical protein Fcan01_24575 [Folsomia candida]|uniref:Uncharacterized protein n=1 Tax=Folsomia candida TaxID=158441 RepID=A0A226D7Q8_FOLCA|nr:hypothetical protein Fcan01_24575 [Folsomia candida]
MENESYSRREELDNHSPPSKSPTENDVTSSDELRFSKIYVVILVRKPILIRHDHRRNLHHHHLRVGQGNDDIIVQDNSLSNYSSLYSSPAEMFTGDESDGSDKDGNDLDSSSSSSLQVEPNENKTTLSSIPHLVIPHSPSKVTS